MLKWEDVTESFSENARHYKNTYLEICEVYGENIEVSLFSSENEPYEIYLSYGIMSGIIYAEKEKAELIRGEVKRELQLEYQNHKEPTDIFINAFCKKHNVCYPNDIYFDTSAFLICLNNLNSQASSEAYCLKKVELIFMLTYHKIVSRK